MKISKSEIYVVVPAYNEAENIVDLIRALKSEGYTNIVIVDDGSTDNTVKLVEKEEVILLRHFINRGPGAATQTGLSFAKLKKAAYTATIDADCQHDPKDITRLLEKAEDYDVVFGSRFLEENKVPFTKTVFNKIANIITFILSTKWVSDSQTGLKLLSKKALNKIYIRTSGFEFCTEIFMQIRVHNLTFVEVPINVKYHKGARNKGQSFAIGINTVFKLFLEAITK